ncbi:MAG: biotin-dependent carboxyltransferase family protein [Rhodococcus sp. (in: high G+C Gram-positive bacteria)]
MSSLQILSPGPLCTLQDRGRPGYAAIGVGRSGAADVRAHDTANRLVGNTVDAATLEATMGGLKLRAQGHLVLAVTGAPVRLHHNGFEEGTYSTLVLSDGDELRLGTPMSGLRSYVAVRGGFDVEPILGSRSTDTMSGLGPAPVAAADVISVGALASDWPASDFAIAPARTGVLGVVPGPRDSWFTNPTLLFQQEWTVSADADRVGIRLDGADALVRSRTGELPSEGMVPGALQVPPDGKPVVFLTDHPVTGGYPVIGVVRTVDLPMLGQLRPGDPVRFAPVRL